jgi:hypothetical protein
MHKSLLVCFWPFPAGLLFFFAGDSGLKSNHLHPNYSYKHSWNIQVKIGNDDLRRGTELAITLHFSDGTSTNMVAVNCIGHPAGIYVGTEAPDNGTPQFDGIWSNTCRSFDGIGFPSQDWDDATDKPKVVNSATVRIIQHNLVLGSAGADNVDMIRVLVSSLDWINANEAPIIVGYCLLPVQGSDARFSESVPEFEFGFVANVCPAGYECQ